MTKPHRGHHHRLAPMLAACAATLIAAATAPVVHAEQTPAGNKNLQELGACIASKHKLDVVVLMDETESLIHEASGGVVKKDRPGTDPNNYRVPAAKGFVEELLKRQQDEGFSTDIRIAGFGQNYNAIPGAESTYGTWTSLTPDTASKVTGILESEKDRSGEQYTNYANAFKGALEEFGRSPNQDACKLLVTFTDGALTADGPDGAAQAKQAICAPGGIADQLRNAGIVHVGIGLSTKNLPSDFSLFKGITSGEGTRCGDVPADGAFFPADSVGSLFASFRQTLGTPGSVTEETNVDQDFTFVLDDSIDSVRFNAIAKENLGPKAHAVLTAPNGTTVDLAGSGSGDADGTHVEFTSSDNPVQQVEGTMTLAKGSSWEGPWKLKFADVEGTGRVFNTAHVQPNLKVAIVSTAEGAGDGAIQMRTDNQLQVSLLDADGAVRSLAGKATLDASFVPSDGSAPIPLTKDADISSGGPLALPLTNIKDYPANGTVDASVTITTKGADGQPGTRLEPITSRAEVSISKINMPSVAGSLPFTLSEKTTTVELPVTGPGTVWIADQDLATTSLPEGMTGVKVTSEYNSPDNALTVAEGEQKTLPVTLSADDIRDGIIAGNIEVTGAETNGEGATVYAVTAQGNAKAPVNTTTFAIVFPLVLLLGLLLPLALFYLVRAMTAKITPEVVRYHRTKGMYNSESGAVTFPNNALGCEDATQFEHAAQRSGSSLTIAGNSLEIVKWKLSPWASPYVVVANPLSTAGDGVTKQGAKLPLNLAGTWFATVDPRAATTGADVPVDVYLLSGLTTNPTQVATIASDIRTRSGHRVASLLAAAAGATGTGSGGKKGLKKRGGTTPSTNSGDPAGPTPPSGPGGVTPPPSGAAPGAPAGPGGVTPPPSGAAPGAPAGPGGVTPPPSGFGPGASSGPGGVAPPPSPGYGGPTPPPSGFGPDAPSSSGGVAPPPSPGSGGLAPKQSNDPATQQFPPVRPPHPGD